MTKFTHEMIERAKGCGSAEELAALAKEDGTELSAAEAKAYYDQLHAVGILEDEELENVAGGCDPKRPVVSVDHYCKSWKCNLCGSNKLIRPSDPEYTGVNRVHKCDSGCSRVATCNTCQYVVVREASYYFCSLNDSN